MARRVTQGKRTAARLIATTPLSVDLIALQTGVSPDTIRKWQRQDEFRVLVADEGAEALAQAKRAPLARKAQRIEFYSRALSRLDRLIEQRAGEQHLSDADRAAGMETGLVVKRYKSIGSGDTAYAEVEYETDAVPVDVGLRVAKQLATELGDFEESGDAVVGGAFIIQFNQRPDGPGADGDSYGHNLYELREQGEDDEE